MGLSVVAIKAAKGRNKPYRLTDSDGLFLLVTPNGGRYWRMNYRCLGKQKTLAFGVWPEVGLPDAREQRDASRKVLARGDDPAETIRLEKLSASIAAANSFKAVADEWLVYQRIEWQATYCLYLGTGTTADAPQDGGKGPL